MLNRHRFAKKVNNKTPAAATDCGAMSKQRHDLVLSGDHC